MQSKSSDFSLIFALHARNSMNNHQFWIENHHIDTSRNQVTFNGQSQSLPPKVVAVLSVLAEQQGQVVSFEQLMAQVWQDRVVSANTLQRCIFQLRQVFNDDSKSQRVIKTHAKKGYSLEVPVSYSKDKPWNKAWLLALFIPLLSVLWFPVQQIPDYLVSTPLTSSDDWEADASYSPDGNYLVFQRFIDNCNNHLWLKDLTTAQQRRLTTSKGVYGRPDWSPDGRQLTFVRRNTCGNQEQHCWSVNTLAVDGAPKEPTERLNCAANPTWQVKWLTDSSIAFLQQNNKKHPELKRLDLKTKAVDTLFMSPAYSYGFDYSKQRQKFAVLSINEDNRHSLDILDLEGNKLQSHNLVLPASVSALKALKARYHPSGDHLIVSTEVGVFQLTLKGRMTPINIGGRANLTDVSYHPDGHTLVATEVIADTDILMFSLNEPEPQKLARSNLSEDNPKFQPGGSLVAYTSKRSGRRQLWLFDGKTSTQLSDLPLGLQSKDIVWSPDGTRIAALARDTLHIWQLDGSFEQLTIPTPIDGILQWHSKNKLLISARGIFEFDISGKHLKTLADDKTHWASYTETGQLIMLNTQGQLQIDGVVTEYPGEIATRYPVLYQGQLFGLNKQQQLWSYSIDERTFQVLSPLPDKVRYVADYNGKHFLLIEMHQFRKDLVKLSSR